MLGIFFLLFLCGLLWLFCFFPGVLSFCHMWLMNNINNIITYACALRLSLLGFYRSEENIMATSLNRRHRDIVETIVRLGGTATVRQIAEQLDLNVNGVSQSLGAPALREFVEDTKTGKAGERVWRLKDDAVIQTHLF